MRATAPADDRRPDSPLREAFIRLASAEVSRAGADARRLPRLARTRHARGSPRGASRTPSRAGEVLGASRRDAHVAPPGRRSRPWGRPSRVPDRRVALPRRGPRGGAVRGVSWRLGVARRRRRRLLLFLLLLLLLLLRGVVFLARVRHPPRARGRPRGHPRRDRGAVAVRRAGDPAPQRPPPGQRALPGRTPPRGHAPAPRHARRRPGRDPDAHIPAPRRPARARPRAQRPHPGVHDPPGRRAQGPRAPLE